MPTKANCTNALIMSAILTSFIYTLGCLPNAALAGSGVEDSLFVCGALQEAFPEPALGLLERPWDFQPIKDGGSASFKGNLRVLLEYKELSCAQPLYVKAGMFYYISRENDLVVCDLTSGTRQKLPGQVRIHDFRRDTGRLCVESPEDSSRQRCFDFASQAYRDYTLSVYPLPSIRGSISPDGRQYACAIPARPEKECLLEILFLDLDAGQEKNVIRLGSNDNLYRTHEGLVSHYGVQVMWLDSTRLAVKYSESRRGGLAIINSDSNVCEIREVPQFSSLSYLGPTSNLYPLIRLTDSGERKEFTLDPATGALQQGIPGMIHFGQCYSMTKGTGPRQLLFGQEPFYTFNEDAYMGDSLEQPSVAVSSDGTRIAWTANESHSRSVLMREPYSGVNVQACATTTEYFWWIPQDELNPSSASPGKVLPGWKFIGDNPWEVMPPIAIIPQDSAVPPGRSASSPGTDGECDFEIKLEKSLFAVNEPVRMNFTLKCKTQRGLWLNPPLSSKGLVRGTVLTPAFSVPLTTWLSNPNEDTKPVFLENGKTLERSLTVIPKGTGEHVIMASYFSTEQSETYAKAPVVHFTVGDGVCAETDSERFTNLLDRLRDAPNRKAQSEVANTIVLLGLDAIPYIQKTIQDEPGEQQPEHPSLDSVRFKLYEAWVLIGEESLIPFTRERLKTCNEQEQLVIIDILTQLYTDPRCGRKPQKQRNPAISSQALEIVFSLTSAGSPSVSRHAIVCLRNQHTPEVEAFFLKMLSDDDPAIRGAALENRMHSLINQDRGYDAEVQALLNPIIDNPEFDTIALNYFELLFASKSYVYDGAAEELFVRVLKRHGAFAYDPARRVYQNRKDIPLDEWLTNTGKNPTQKEFLRLQEVIADFAAHSKGDKPALFAEDWDSIQGDGKAMEAYRKNLESWIEYALKHPKYPPFTSRAHSVEK